MSIPTVTVIMATYNHAPFVKQAMKSVLAQEGVEFEFLIADDGSSDETREVIAGILDSRVKFFPNTVNRGACIVTNELIERSSGEFIALINSDDYWLSPDKLAYQIKILRDRPDVGACFGRASFVNKNGDRIDKKTLAFGNTFDQKNRSQGAWLRRFFEFGNCICHPTILIRKACYEEIGMYNNQLRQLPDFDMWIRLVKHYNIYISERELISFRVLPGENASSQTVPNAIRTINEHFLIALNFFDDIKASQLIDGFSDYLVIQNIPSEQHLDIEKARLFFIENQWLGKPYKMVGLPKMYSLLSSPRHRELMCNTYGLDDRWFQKEMATVDTLRPMVIEQIKQNTNKIISAFHVFIKMFRKKT